MQYYKIIDIPLLEINLFSKLVVLVILISLNTYRDSSDKQILCIVNPWSQITKASRS